MTMRRTLGQSLALPLVLPLLLTGLGTLSACGSDVGAASDRSGSSESAPAEPSEPGAPSSGSSSNPAAGRVDFEEVALVSETAAGGRVTKEPVRLDDAAAVRALTGRLRSEGLGRKVARAVRGADVPADQALLGAVVSVGCDVPPGVRVEDTGAGPAITALPVESPLQECFAPVTTVAVVSVPADAL